MRRVLFILVLLILYGSLYPWHFSSTPLRPLFPPLEFSDMRDLLLNFWLYAPLGAAGYWAFSGAGKFRIPSVVALGFSLSLFVECVQVFVPGRVSSQRDLLSNTAGTIAGVGIALLFQRLPQAGRYAARWSVEAFLLLSWFAYMTLPLIPVRGPWGVRLRFQAFQETELLWYDAVLWAVVWVIIAQLIPAVFSRGAKPWQVFTACLLLVPARLLIVTRVLTKAELVGAVAGTLIVALGLLGLRVGPMTTAGVLFAALLVRGLAPFEFSSFASTFSWLPFSGWLGGDWQSATVGVALKVFLYGAAVWALHRCGWNWMWSGVATAGFLFAIEILQRHIPPHVPEVTDPLVALACAAAFTAWHEKTVVQRPVYFQGSVQRGS